MSDKQGSNECADAVAGHTSTQAVDADAAARVTYNSLYSSASSVCCSLPLRQRVCGSRLSLLSCCTGQGGRMYDN